MNGDDTLLGSITYKEALLIYAREAFTLRKEVAMIREMLCEARAERDYYRQAYERGGAA